MTFLSYTCSYDRYYMCGHPYRTDEQRRPDPSWGAETHAGWQQAALSSRAERVLCSNGDCKPWDCEWFSNEYIVANDGWCPTCDSPYNPSNPSESRKTARE